MIRLRREYTWRRESRWIGIRGDAHGRRCVVGTFRRAAWFVLTGRGFQQKPPFWSFRVDLAGSVHGPEASYSTCSAGFFSRWAYVEVVQGVDIATTDFYRWLRIGIPRLGCWRIRLQKRSVT